MRPDEHKKKKNAQYKKKHGIADKKHDGASQETASDDKNPSDPSEKDVKGRGRPNDDRDDRFCQPKGIKSDESELLPKPTLVHGDEKDDDHSKVYSRRKVESNWQRYEEQNDEEMRRGADLTEVLKNANHIKPEFQFKPIDDLCIGADVPSNVTGEQMNFLSLDCERLAAALNSVPLYKRLDIDVSVFEKSHIEALDKEAAQSREAYMKTSSGSLT